ncbi:hypothetical protein OAP32_00405 [Crocinitomicaceae bacterium]|nr:hypothetical protein [Crocinitomicaceae bacterium]
MPIQTAEEHSNCDCYDWHPEGICEDCLAYIDLKFDPDEHAENTRKRIQQDQEY